MLIGKAERKIDAAGRLLIPPRFRRGLEVEGAGTVYVSLWTPENGGDHLRLYPESVFNRLYEEQRTPGFEVDPGLLRITSSTESVEVDGNLRVRIDAGALKEIGVEPKGLVLMVGGGNHVQVWSPERWAATASALPSLPGGRS